VGVDLSSPLTGSVTCTVCLRRPFYEVQEEAYVLRMSFLSYFLEI